MVQIYIKSFNVPNLYTYVYIRKNGDIKSTRPLERIGAHSRGFNRESIGICYEGGLDAHGCPADTRTPEQRAALKLLVHQLLETFPGSRVCGHRDLSPDRNGNGEIEPEEWIKACPCFEVKAEFGVTAARHLNSRPDNNDMCPTRHLVRRS